jgi:diguanylate cyclase (GGDEF)-like protein
MSAQDASSQMSSEVQTEVHSDLVETLFDTFGSFAVSLIGGITAPASAWLMTGESVYLALLAVSLALAMYRISVWLAHSKAPSATRRAEAKIWEIRYSIGGVSFVTAVGATAAILFYRHHLDISFVIGLVIMMAGVGALSGRNAGSPNIVFLQLIGLCGPLALITAIDDDHRYRWLTFILILEVISIKSTTKFLHKNLVTALTNERDAKIQRNRFKMALNSMTHGLCMGDVGSVISVINHRMIDFFGIAGTTTPVRLQALAKAISKNTRMSEGESDAFVARWTTHALLPRANVFSQRIDDRMFDFHCEPASAGAFVTVIEDVTEKRKATEEIERIAHFDTLTGLMNRFQFQKRLERDLDQLVERNAQLTLFNIDLDLFKEVNDTLGHTIGDLLLCEVATRLRNCVRMTDMVARFGGDEFCILLESGERLSKDDVEAIAKRIIDAIRQPYFLDGHTIVIGASVGIAVAPKDAETPESLLKCSDLAMYSAKAKGRCEAVWFEAKLHEHLIEKRRIEEGLRHALSAGELSVHYQPIVDARDGRVTCCEALMRWRHPQRGFVRPADFIPVAEETGLIIELGEWVLRQACHDAMSWPSCIRVAVNLAPRQFQAPNLAAVVQWALADSGLDPDRLELEITESTLMQDTVDISRKIAELEALGVRLSLDDFGTGYSSLGYLNRFPVKKVKIDRSFTLQLIDSVKTQAIVGAVAQLSRDLDIELVAEGVETQEQLALFAVKNVFLIQGYLFSQPKPVEDLRPLLEPSLRTFGQGKVA